MFVSTTMYDCVYCYLTEDDAQSKELYGARLRVDENKVKELADEVEVT